MPFSQTLRRSTVQVAVLSLTLSALATGSAAAQGAAPWQPDFGFQIGIASEFVGKGIGKSNGEISPFASAEVSGNDLYASVFVASAELSQGANAAPDHLATVRPAARSVPRSASRPSAPVPSRTVTAMKTIGRGGAALKYEPVASTDGWEEF